MAALETAMQAQPTAPVVPQVAGAPEAAPAQRAEAVALEPVALQGRPAARGAPEAAGPRAMVAVRATAEAPAALAAPDRAGTLGAVEAPVVGVESRRTRARDGLVGGTQRWSVVAGAGLVLGCARPERRARSGSKVPGTSGLERLF
ncbi:MAG TPA: hypothetical protein VI072_09040 [Polyangiaceae bacterium]